MNADQFINQSRSFIEWMLGWKAGLQPLSINSVIQNEPDKVGIISVDVIKGFCTVGPLSSPRINQIVQPITRLFENAWAKGVRDIALPQDTHPEDAVEFAQYAPHCIRGTEQSQTVDSFKELPFFDQIAVVEKNSINCGVNQAFLDWFHARPHIKTWIAVGDCTDICTYQLAMYLRVWANENQQRDFRVIVPVDCVDTYDLPVERALEIGATPHGGELLHLVSLYHMMLNGIEIVSEITNTD
jgi:nicotinamidase-related amidase